MNSNLRSGLRLVVARWAALCRDRSFPPAWPGTRIGWVWPWMLVLALWKQSERQEQHSKSIPACAQRGQHVYYWSFHKIRKIIRSCWTNFKLFFQQVPRKFINCRGHTSGMAAITAGWESRNFVYQLCQLSFWWLDQFNSSFYREHWNAAHNLIDEMIRFLDFILIRTFLQ